MKHNGGNVEKDKKSWFQKNGSSFKSNKKKGFKNVFKRAFNSKNSSPSKSQFQHKHFSRNSSNSIPAEKSNGFSNGRHPEGQKFKSFFKKKVPQNPPENEPEKSDNLTQKFEQQNVEMKSEENVQNFDRNSLPVMSSKVKLLEEFQKSSTFVIIGETGSGKTTQIPQFILDGKLNKNKKIAITQPRRIAAISMAKRVAEERGEIVGQTVGYSVRFEDMTSEGTRVKYMTDGMLLREAMGDSSLRKYSWIVLDEAHERTIHTDVLFGVVKAAQVRRAGMKTKKRLKVVVMSATIDVDCVSKFFDNCSVLYIEGREHPVTINYLKSPIQDDDYRNAVVKTVFQLHDSIPLSEHMLVFLTGQEEIESVAHFIRKVMESTKLTNLQVRTLYASLSYEAQLEALTPPDSGIRRCILSTNVAETSLTIPGIRVVIDTGKVKTRFHIRGIGVDRLQIVPISQAQAWQRSGRAGRQAPGKCYRLYTAEEFLKMPLFPVPEIQRSNMAGVVLHLVKIGITSPLSFDWIDGPPKESIQAAIKELYGLEAIVSEKEPLELTEAGNLMARIPLDPPLAKVLVNAKSYGVVEPVMTILSILSSESLLSSSEGKKSQGFKKRFCAPEGDLITYLKIYREFKKTATKSSWCKMNGLNLRSLQYAAKVRCHLRQLLESEGIQVDSTLSGSAAYENIRKCFFQSLPQNCAQIVQGNRYVVKSPGQLGLPTKIHPSSSLFNSKAPIVSFTEILQVSKDSQLMCHVSLVDPEWLAGVKLLKGS